MAVGSTQRRGLACPAQVAIGDGGARAAQRGAAVATSFTDSAVDLTMEAAFVQTLAELKAERRKALSRIMDRRTKRPEVLAELCERVRVLEALIRQRGGRIEELPCSATYRAPTEATAAPPPATCEWCGDPLGDEEHPCRVLFEEPDLHDDEDEEPTATTSLC